MIQIRYHSIIQHQRVTYYHECRVINLPTYTNLSKTPQAPIRQLRPRQEASCRVPRPDTNKQHFVHSYSTTIHPVLCHISYGGVTQSHKQTRWPSQPWKHERQKVSGCKNDTDVDDQSNPYQTYFRTGLPTMAGNGPSIVPACGVLSAVLILLSAPLALAALCFLCCRLDQLFTLESAKGCTTQVTSPLQVLYPT